MQVATPCTYHNPSASAVTLTLTLTNPNPNPNPDLMQKLACFDTLTTSINKIIEARYRGDARERFRRHRRDIDPD